MPMASGKPMADQIEYRPPTQSHIGNIFFSLIPKLFAALILLETQAKLCSISVTLACFKNHSFADSVFLSVS